MNDSRETRLTKAFVAGFPIKHSRSPLIHNFWLREHGISGSYLKEEVSPDDFSRFIQKFKSGESGYLGGNITIPHKESAAGLADRRDELVNELGAANTLWLEEGLIRATNTDGYGFNANLDDLHPGWDARGGKAVVYGAGGASRAVIQAIRDRGFSEIHVLNRTLSRAQELAARLGSKIHPGQLNSAAECMAGADLFVNTTSLGMQGDPVPVLDFDCMASDAVVTDIVYVPLITPFLAAAEEQGRAIVGGLGMLLHQAVPGFEKWFGVRPVVSTELRKLITADIGGQK